MDGLTTLLLELTEKHSLLTKAEAGYQRLSHTKDIDNNRLIKAGNRRLELSNQCEYIEHEIAMLVIPEEFRNWNSLKIKKDYVKSRNKFHIYYGDRGPLCKGHGHCVIDLVKNEVVYHRPFGASHGRQNHTHQ